MKIWTLKGKHGREYRYLNFRVPADSDVGKMIVHELQILGESPQKYVMRVFNERKEKRY